MNKQTATVLASNPSALTWIQTLELGYEVSSSSAATELSEAFSAGRRCFYCQREASTADSDPSPEKLLQCSKCRVAWYCQKECQVQDWKKRHKKCCDSFGRVGSHMNFSSSGSLFSSSTDPYTVDQKKETARRDVFQRIRFYACAYAVHQSTHLGQGFLFIQSNQTLAAISLALPLDVYGYQPIVNRGVLLHYLTLGEYDAEVCRDDFEMATIRSQLQTALQQQESNQDVVLLMRFRCGHVALGVAKLVPDFNVCRKLGMDYFGDSAPPSLQLNIDDDAP